MIALYPKNSLYRALVTDKKPLPLPLPFDTVSVSGNCLIKYLGLGAGMPRKKNTGLDATQQNKVDGYVGLIWRQKPRAKIAPLKMISRRLLAAL